MPRHRRRAHRPTRTGRAWNSIPDDSRAVLKHFTCCAVTTVRRPTTPDGMVIMLHAHEPTCPIWGLSERTA